MLQSPPDRFRWRGPNPAGTCIFEPKTLRGLCWKGYIFCDFFFHRPYKQTTMPASTRSVAAYEDGLECTPDSLFKGLAGCFGFLLTVTVVASLGVIAGGVFLTARNMDRITSDGNYVTMHVIGAVASSDDILSSGHL